MDNNKVNIVNGSVVGVFLGKPMQDATPDKPEDNEVYATERNTVTRVPNSENTWEEQPKPTGGGVSSWNDLTDKPFGKEQSEVVVLAEQTVVTDVRGDIGMGNLVSNETELFAGETYEVVFDGKTYICVAQTVQAFGDLVAVGNVGLSEQWVTSIGVEDTGEPFCFIVGNGWILATKTAGTYTISAKRMTETIKTIDPEYLPAGVGGDFVVTISYDENENLVADKTLDELAEALSSGRKISAACIPGGEPDDAVERFYLPLVASYVSGDSKEFSFCSVVNLDRASLVARKISYTNNGIEEEYVELWVPNPA